ncbi:cytochrome P450 [Solicola sp. PLA-1-18]|uniref:cytochrome P450 n=1 Tax=Solicola sp. PLA-1-18 TaxID=3380532 RepID=UPI003B7DD328
MTTATLTTDLDLTDPGFVADPYPALASLRRIGPMVRHETRGTWLATSHAAVSAVLRDRAFGRVWTDREPAAQMKPFNDLHQHQMMENEPPQHTRLRRLVAGAFGRGHVERMRPRVQALASELLDAFDGPVVDVVGAYAEPLPVLVIADLLGVPGEDHELLRDWSQAIVKMYEHDVPASTRDAAVAASTAFSDYVRAFVAERRHDPREDLVTDLIAATEEGGRLSEDELVASVVLLLNAGHEASVNAFGNGLASLLQRPDQLARVTSGEVSVESALEELLRFDAPLQLFERTCLRDSVVLGTPVAAGETVACLMGSANRDAAVFAEPDDLDVARDPNPHVGFGMGVHFCLGAPLARLELQISLGELLRRHPGLSATGVAPRRPTFVLRGLERLDVDLEGSPA